MVDTANENPLSMLQVDALKAMPLSQFELWKYYENRAEKIGLELWAVGIWMMTIIAATLSLPFMTGFIKISTTVYPLEIAGRLPTIFIALFGCFFCLYCYVALRDMREHIENNWRKAGYVLDGTWQARWEGRKSYGWTVLLFVGALALSVFTGLLVAAIVN